MEVQEMCHVQQNLQCTALVSIFFCLGGKLLSFHAPGLLNTELVKN